MPPATGSNHVDPAVTRQVVGVDVNLQYLGIARQRFFQLGPRLELYNADVLAFRAAKGPFDLVHAALLLEYVEPGALVGRFREWLGPKGTCSVVLELAGGDGPEPPSRALKLIARAANHLDPGELTRRCALVGLALLREKQVPLKHGRRFWHGVFGRNIRRQGA